MGIRGREPWCGSETDARSARVLPSRTGKRDVEENHWKLVLVRRRADRIPRLEDTKPPRAQVGSTASSSQFPYGDGGELFMKLVATKWTAVFVTLTMSTGAIAQSYYDDQACRQYADARTAPLRDQANSEAVGGALLGAGLGAALGAAAGTVLRAGSRLSSAVCTAQKRYQLRLEPARTLPVECSAAALLRRS